MQWNRASDRTERAEALLLMLDVQFLVEQSQPQGHRFAGQGRLDLIEDAVDLNPGIDADLASFRFASKGPEPFPGTHGAQALRRQPAQPVLRPGVRLGAVRRAIVADHIGVP